MKCPYCNNETPDGSLRCEVCNANLEVPINQDGDLTKKHVVSNVIKYFNGPVYITIGVIGLFVSYAILKEHYYGALGGFGLSIGLILYGIYLSLSAVDAFAANKELYTFTERVKRVASYLFDIAFLVGWIAAIVAFLRVVYMTSDFKTSVIATIFTTPFWLCAVFAIKLMRKK